MERIRRGHVLKSPVDEIMFNHRTHPMIHSVERDARINRGEINEVRETPEWESIRVQIDLGALDTVGPKEIAKAFEMECDREQERCHICCAKWKRAQKLR